jgi:glycosyltransferase involved in cell wall biosynthesis
MRLTPRHIGLYCPGNGTGGPWRYVHSIIAGIDPNEFDVSVFCDLLGVYEPRPSVKVVPLGGPQTHPGGAPLTVTRPAPFARTRVVRLAPPAVRLWAGIGRQSRRLIRLLRHHAVDLFHTQNTGCEESPVAAKLAGIRHVLGTFHVDSTYDLHRKRSGPGHRLLEMVSNRCLDTAIAVSNATKRDWLRRTHISADRVITIHNGIDPDRVRRRQSRDTARQLLGLPADRLIVGGLGRLDEAKGFIYLLEAVASIRQEFNDLVVAIAGTGPLREQLENRAAALGLGERVRFLGFRSDVQQLLDALDVFALPSRCEALPFALLEAMATELPVVGTSVGGVPEVIVPGETGFIVPPQNPAALAAALRTLLNDSDLRTRMGEAGRERVITHFHERDMVQKTINLYREVCA